jgi:acyl-CoA synthetase (AMP-forming)/AMP-acid ligase II
MDVRIHDLLVRAALVSPSGIGATMGDEARTFAELDAGSNRAAHRLMGEGVQPGDRVAWWGPSALDALELGYGISKAGATLSPVNPHFTEPEAVAALETLAPRLVVAHPDVADAAHAAADPLGVPILVMHHGWADGAATASPPRVGTSEDPSVVFLTSGSTGVSKGAMISHRAAWLRAVQRDSETGATQRRGAVVMFGLFHMSGWSMIEGAWAIDRPVHLVTRAEPAALLGAVERWRATGLYCIPSVWERVLADDGTYDTSSLVEANTGTSLVSLDLLHALKARFPGSWTSIAYGSTEIGRGATLLDPDLFTHPGSVGQPPPMTLADLSPDGELWLRGPTMFSGYLDRPDATAEAIDEQGWFHTGDLATRDADGFLTITGRRSESIRSGGEWVTPLEVEAAVGTHPAVAEVAVVGLPDASWGELVCAAIVVRPGASLPTVAELRAHVAGTLVGPKQPRVVVEVDALPRTDATGQIRRRRLRDTLVADGVAAPGQRVS